MYRIAHPFTRIATLATLALTTVLLMAGRAAAIQPEPGGPAETEGGRAGSGGESVLLVTESSISALQWALFAAAVMGALVVGASVMHLAEQRRSPLAH